MSEGLGVLEGNGRLLEGNLEDSWKVSPQKSPCDKRPATKNLLALKHGMLHGTYHVSLIRRFGYRISNIGGIRESGNRIFRLPALVKCWARERCGQARVRRMSESPHT